ARSYHSPLEGESKQAKPVLVGGAPAAGAGKLNATGSNAANTNAGAYTLWGRAYYTNFDVNENPAKGMDFNGDVQGVVGGIDRMLKDNLLVGLALSNSKVDLDYTLTDERGDLERGTQETTVQAIHPYFGWQLSETRFWGSVALGQGDTELSTRERPEDVYKRDLDMQTTALGLSSKLFASRNDGLFAGATLSIIADAFYTTVDQGSAESEAGQMRLGLEAKHSRSLDSGTNLGANMSLTTRIDFGDALAGSGLEFAGGFDFKVPRHGLTFDMEYRTLLTHNNDVEEWGISGGLAWVPGSIDGQGFSLSFKPQWGSTGSRSQAIWDDGMAGRKPSATASAFNPQGRYTLEMKYDLPILSGEEMLGFFTRNEAGAEGQRIRLGGTLNLTNGLTAEYEAALQPGPGQPTEHKAQLKYERKF
ncbi:MAG: autotransporter domain-containing protein, partial [Pseudomonadales bacterium]